MHNILEKIRTFLSLNLDSSFKNEIVHVQSKVKEYLKNYFIKWESTDKLHLTLRFFGDTEKTIIDTITYELDRIDLGFSKITLQTYGTGFFPSIKRPNVVFIDLKEEGNCTAQLVEKTDSVIDKLGLKRDKNFVPHITIGRFKGKPRAKIDAPKVNDKIKLEFNSFFLMKSMLNPKGSEYFIIKEFPFKKI